MFRKSTAVPLVLMGSALLFLGYGCYQGWWDQGRPGHGGRGGGPGFIGRGPHVFMPTRTGGSRPIGVPSSPRGGFGKTGGHGIGA